MLLSGAPYRLVGRAGAPHAAATVLNLVDLFLLHLCLCWVYIFLQSRWLRLCGEVNRGEVTIWPGCGSWQRWSWWCLGPTARGRRRTPQQCVPFGDTGWRSWLHLCWSLTQTGSHPSCPSPRTRHGNRILASQTHTKIYQVICSGVLHEKSFWSVWNTLTTHLSQIRDILSSVPLVPSGIRLKLSLPTARWEVWKVQWALPVTCKSPLGRRKAAKWINYIISDQFLRMKLWHLCAISNVLSLWWTHPSKCHLGVTPPQRASHNRCVSQNDEQLG